MLQFYRSLLLLVASLALSNAHEVRLSFDDASLQYQPSVCTSACGTTCDKQWFDECPQGPKSERLTRANDGTSLQFDFQGDSIAWHSRIFNLGGVAYVSIDGGAAETVDTASSASRPDNEDAVVWTKTGLDPSTKHHVVIHFDTPTTPAKLRIRADEPAPTGEATTPAKPEGAKTEGAGTSQTTESVPASSVAATESSPLPTTSASEQPLSTTSASDPILSVKAEPTPPAAPGSPPLALPPTLPAGGAPQPAPPSRPGRPDRPGPGEGPDRHGHPGEGPGQASPPAAPQPPTAPPAPPAPPPPQQATPPAPVPPAAAPQPPTQPPAQPPAQQAPQPPAQPPAAAAPASPAQDPVTPVQPSNVIQANPVGSTVQIVPLPTAASPAGIGILAGSTNRFISIKQFVITVPDGVASASPADQTPNVNATGDDTPQASSQDPTVNMAAVGGGVAAGVVLLALLGGFFFVERRKKLKRKRDSDPFAGADAHESKWRQLPDDVEAQRNAAPSITVSPPGVGRRTTIIHRSEVISQQPSLASTNPSLAVPESMISGQASSDADAPPEEFLEKSEIEAYNYRWSLFTAPPVGAVPPATAQ